MRQFIDFKKMYDAGIVGLKNTGGEILEDRYYREKDVMEGDYSNPIHTGKCELKEVKPMAQDQFIICFVNGDMLIMTKDEYKAGLVKE